MPAITSIMEELDERTIAREVAIPHDEARIRYPLTSNTVTDFREFEDIIAGYLEYHSAVCVAVGGRMSPSMARSRAKNIHGQGQRGGEDVRSAYSDAHFGTNGGMRIISSAL